jgi:tetratricopeptide (TPR) repeat protein
MAIKGGHGDYFTHLRRGLAYFKLGKPANAISDFDKAIGFDPKIADAFYCRGIVKLKQGDGSGDADLAKAKGIKPNIADEYAKYKITS